MNKSLLVKVFGFPATLIHGDPLVLSRWFWLRKRLPRTNNEERLIDIGCGTGAFTIGAARRGYFGLGLSWDERNQKIAAERAQLCNADKAQFEILDVRNLGERVQFFASFDYAICLETTEHILDDRALFTSIGMCLKPGGYMLLTTPNLRYRIIDNSDLGPFVKEETGWHVRRGYSAAMLKELCGTAGLEVEEISYCGGYFSQKVTGVQRFFEKHSTVIGWLIVLPLRILPLLFDRIIRKVFDFPDYSIGLIAYKRRFNSI